MDRPFYPAKIIECIPTLLPYLLVTFEILFGTMIVGLVLGFFLARARLSKRAWKRHTAGFIINAFRCTPSIVMLFMIFYGLPNLFWALFHVDINDWAKGFYVITALGLLFSANMAEIMRASYLAVPAGQREAALTSGLTEERACLRIMLPQAFVVSIPNLGNSMIALLKEGSLAFTIGLIDVMGRGNLLISLHYGAYALETYIAQAVIYWTLTLLLEQLFKRFERRFSKG
ncbi:MAG: amino acid ABC transporter permease, partial [Treponemataceae bacterium]|nr:amino acid ABC transporter permease [Treponemataceae bacterium]